MDQLAEWIAIAARWCSEPHRLTIVTVATMVEAGFIFVVVLGLCRRVLEEERWIKPFAFAFLALFLQYSSRAVAHILGSDSTMPDRLTDTVVWAVLAILSICNDLLFLASARAMLMLKKLVPWWAVVLGALIAVFTILGRDLTCHRLPDGLFSAACMIALGYGVFACMRGSRLIVQFVRFVALLGAGLYALSILFGSIIPYLDNAEPAKQIWPALLSSLKEQFPNGDPKEFSAALEALVMAVTFAWKLFLFAGAFVLVVGAIVPLVPREATRAMRRAAGGHFDYLSAKGIVEALARVVGADAAEISLLRPGLMEDQMRYWRWSRLKDAELYDGAIKPVPSPKESIVGRVLSSGERFLKQKGRIPRDNPRLFGSMRVRKISVIGEPILQQGGIIGCLVFWWSKPYAISATVNRRIGEMAVWLGPTFQTHRHFDALDRCSRQIHLTATGKAEEEVVERVTRIVQRYLSPLATAVCVDFGFRTIAVACNGRDSREYCWDTNRPKYLRTELQSLAREIANTSLAVEHAPLEIYAASEKRAAISVGQIFFAIRAGADTKRQPTLARDPVLRKAIGAQVGIEILDCFRQTFWELLRRLRVDLFSTTAPGSVDSWFKAVASCARHAGFKWAVVGPTGAAGHRGDAEAIEIVQQCGGEPTRVAGFTEGVKQYTVHVFGHELQQVIRLDLAPSRQQLWLGVLRSDFGPELDFHSPWLVFLERFAELAGSALAHTTAAIELESVQLTAARQQTWAAVTVTHGTLVHQLVNLTRDVACGTKTLLDAYHLERLSETHDAAEEKTYGRLLGAVKASADRARELTTGIQKSTALDAHRPCLLADAVQHATNLYRTSLTRLDISLQSHIEDGLCVDMPFYVLALALANLIGNAAEALHEKGAITIDAEKAEGYIHCWVTDDGPGIPEQICDRVFDFGVTTKRGSGGWGLYLVRRSLRENGGDIVLEQGEFRGARFRLLLPCARNGKC